MHYLVYSRISWVKAIIRSFVHGAVLLICLWLKTTIGINMPLFYVLFLKEVEKSTLLIQGSTVKLFSPVHGLYKIDYIKSRSVPWTRPCFTMSKWRNEWKDLHTSIRNNKTSLTGLTAKFGNNSYIGKNTQITYESSTWNAVLSK